ncbi:acyltransferase [Marinicrinis lubricantis]|uniref:Acyltransferase n=1 Tax=Marinicrinis lubricantis TaxID=2086470 RepID=A0ABW1IR44_9BACL
MKSKIEELDIVRAFAMIGVLLIHGTSQATVSLAVKSTTHNLFLAVNRFSLFAVPVFLMLSALVLFYRYGDEWDAGRIRSFYSKRIKFILLPYLIWSVVYYTYNYIWPKLKLGLPWQPGEMAANFLERLLLGQNGPHLYYFILMFQLYLIFPLLMSLAKRLRRAPMLFIALCVAINAAFYLFTYWYTPRYGPIPQRATYIFGYMGLIGVGAMIGMHYHRFVQRLDRLKLAPIGFMAISGSALVLCYLLSYWGIYRPQTITFDIVFHLHALFSAAAFITLSRWLLRRHRPLSRMFTSLGSASFGIYLTHVLILSILRNTIELPSTTAGYSLYTFGFIVITTAVSWIFVKMARKWKYQWILFGR